MKQQLRSIRHTISKAAAILSAIFVSVYALLMTAVPPAQAADIPVTPSCAGQQLSFAPIESGLWSGVNLDAGSLYTTQGTKVTASSNGLVCSIPDNSAAITNGLWAGVNAATGTTTIPNPFANTNPCSVGGVACVTPQTPTQMPPPTAMPSPTPTPTQPPATPAPSLPSAGSGGNYAAMGDSVAAGLGLSGDTGPSGCGQTTQGYPFTVAARVGMSLHNVSCSGATVGDTFTSQETGSVNQPPQLDAIFASGKPQLITITAGANDAKWADFATLCWTSNCATTASTVSANALLLALQAKLLIMMHSITSRSGGSPPTVVMTGYYNPISSACVGKFSNITADEINWMNAEVNALNLTIQGVVSIYSFARFAPVSFAGHDLCSGSPWVQSIGSPAPFHPTAVGQQTIAQDVLRTLGK